MWVKEAYDVLDDAERRAAYDRTARAAAMAEPVATQMQTGRPATSGPRLSDLPIALWAGVGGLFCLAAVMTIVPIVQLTRPPPPAPPAAARAFAPSAPQVQAPPMAPMRVATPAADLATHFVLPSGGSAVLWRRDPVRDGYLPGGQAAEFTPVQVLRRLPQHGLVEIRLTDGDSGFVDAARLAPGDQLAARFGYIERPRQMKWLWKRLRELAAMEISREEMLMKLGATRSRAPTAWRLIEIDMDRESSMFIYALNRQRLRKVRRREGRHLLRTNLIENDPALLWRYYIQLVAVEQAFKNLKGDLAIRPVFHQDERRIEAHIFIAFLAYCLQVTLQRRLHALAPGLSARSALEKFAAVQMIDVHLPTTD